MKSLGMDISGREVRYLELKKDGGRFTIGRHGKEIIPEIVGTGVSATEGLKLLRKKIGSGSARTLSPYTKLFSDAGFTIAGFEDEDKAVARAVVRAGDVHTYILIDLFGGHAMLSLVHGGEPQFTSVVQTGDIGSGFTNTLAPLAREVDIHHAFWYRNRSTPSKKIQKVLVSGDGAGTQGLPEYLTNVFRVPVERANVWVNVLGQGDTVPDIGYKDALGFSRAIGLALGGCR